jgi:hypothetical protein
MGSPGSDDTAQPRSPSNGPNVDERAPLLGSRTSLVGISTVRDYANHHPEREDADESKSLLGGQLRGRIEPGLD